MSVFVVVPVESGSMAVAEDDRIPKAGRAAVAVADMTAAAQVEAMA